MRAHLRAPLALAALLLGACQQDPGGRCGNDDRCSVGQECVDGICIRLDTDHQVGSRCARDADCVAWASCSARTCALRPGMCVDGADCAGFWEQCTGQHACVLAPGMCYAQPDCSPWKTCTDHACLLQAGRCDLHSDCSAWQYCSTEHWCTDVGGTCAVDGDCQAWQTCLSGHCGNQPGKCATDPECDPTWQACDEVNHDCIAAPGKCTHSGDCSAWETCSALHVCASATRCTTSSECRAPDLCSGGWCTYAAPLASSEVLLWGTLLEGAAYVDALARLSSPTRALVGFADSDHLHHPEYIDPNGNLVYVHGGYPTGETIRRFVTDPWEWDRDFDHSEYPASPDANDTVIGTPACAGKAFTGFVMQAGTGAILYQCAYDGAFYDTAGTAQVAAGYSAILAWNSSGAKLAVRSPYEPVIVGSDGVELPVTGQPEGGWYLAFNAWRSHSSGFWVAVDNAVWDGPQQLWSISDGGVATLVGSLPDVPTGLDPLMARVIDPSGAVYGWSSGPLVFEDVVLRCRVGDSVCAIAYDEANATDDDYSVYPPHVYVRIHISELVTGP